MSSLLNKELYDEFTEDVADDYESIREDYFDSLKVITNCWEVCFKYCCLLSVLLALKQDRRYLSLEKARSKAPKIDWKSYSPSKCLFNFCPYNV